MPAATLFDDRFLLAVGLLSGFFAVQAVRDRRIHGAGATAWRNYTWLFAVAGAAAVFGAVTDSITSKISPEYFVLGKGLVRDARFSLRVMASGAQAGFAAGMVAGAVMLFVNDSGRKSGRMPLCRGKLSVCAAGTLLFAALGAFLAGQVPPEFFPLKLDPEIAFAFGQEITARFESTQNIHLGAYLGAAAGLTGSVAFALRRRHAAK